MRILKDFFTTTLDLSWKWNILFFAIAFFSSWLLFAVVWYLTALHHGDFDPENLNNQTFKPCVSDIHDFTSCFLFSVETQHTIGYGGRATTEQCPIAIIVMTVQSIFGVIIQACMAGIIFAKFTIANKRSKTIVFSKNAVVHLRDGALWLTVQIADLQKRSLLEAHIRMILVQNKETLEGEKVPFYRQDLPCSSEINDEANDRVLMIWPTVVGHKINSESPLYRLEPAALPYLEFEILIVVEGTTPETGNTIQAMTSYLPNEILWNQHFRTEMIMAYDETEEMYEIRDSFLNHTMLNNTPRISAFEIDNRKEDEDTEIEKIDD